MIIFGHKLLSKHIILSVTFIVLRNLCDLPVSYQISLYFYRKKAESPGFENFRLTGLSTTKLSVIKGYFRLEKLSKNC